MDGQVTYYVGTNCTVTNEKDTADKETDESDTSDVDTDDVDKNGWRKGLSGRMIRLQMDDVDMTRKNDGKKKNNVDT